MVQPAGWIFMTLGYLSGCAAGVWMAASANLPVTWLDAGLYGVTTDSDLLAALTRCGTYGFVLLLLSTSYLGFVLVPLILACKGFLTGSAITVCLRGDSADAWATILIQIGLPGLLLLPALLLLGALSMRRSVRLMSMRWSEQPLPPGESDSRPLAAAAILLLLTAAMKTYVIPAIWNWL